MAVRAQTVFILLAFISISTSQQIENEDTNQLPLLDATEQEAVYRILELINGDIPWRMIFPDDLCIASPHGVVCDYFFDNTSSSQPDSAHITELNFGYVSDYNSNPPCAANASKLPFWIFSSLTRLRKLFIFNCFNGVESVLFPDVPVGYGTELEELVLIDNPSLTGSLTGIVRSFVNLKKLVVTGSGFFGNIPEEVGAVVRLEQMSLSGNKLNGDVSEALTNLTRLKILDLSRNEFEGTVPESIGEMKSLLKLDLSFNNFTGKIPDGIGQLSELEFLDLSYNRFEGNGVPMFFNQMVKLKEVYLNGNNLSGEIPDVWGKLGGLVGLGLSGLGLTGEIPESMATSLTGLSYLNLENNSLTGTVPNGFLEMENLKEINLENNKLSGAIRLKANVTMKRLKLAGNSGLCVDQSLTGNSVVKNGVGVKACDDVVVSEMPVSAEVLHHVSSSVAAAATAASDCLVSPYLYFGLILSFCL